MKALPFCGKLIFIVTNLVNWWDVGDQLSQACGVRFDDATARSGLEVRDI